MSAKKRTYQNLLQGSMILAVATALVKVLGAIYRIPLNNMLGELGAGYYSTAYDLYLPIYSLAMAGLPVAISRMVAESMATKRYGDTRRLLKLAQRAFLITGVTGTVLMVVVTYFYLYNDWFRTTFNITADANCVYAIVLIAFSVLFCCIMSTYRGYYEGLRNMIPTAVSQVIEATGKLVLGLVLVWLTKYVCINVYGMTETQSLPFAAGAAVLGVTLGAAAGALYLRIQHKVTGDGITEEELAASPQAQPSGVLLKSLFAIALPIVIGSMVRDVAGLVDLTTVKSRLGDVVGAVPDLTGKYYGITNLSAEEMKDLPTYLYGIYKGFAFSIYNLVPTITSVIGVSAIPALSTSWAQKDKEGIHQSSESIIRLTAMIALPAGVGIACLSGPILQLLYSGRPNAVIIATPILSVLGISAIFAGMAVPLTNMLQAIGKQNIPVVNMAVGVVLKIVINYALVGVESVNIKGAAVGTAVCYGYILIANLVCYLRFSKAKVNLISTLFKPAFAAILCGVAAFGANKALALVIGASKINTAISIIIAALVYAICLGVTRSFTENDIKMLPKGEKIAKLLAKIKWIG